VKKAVDAEHLGGQETLDLLCVSFSCNDPVGHTWGPDSQEVLDTTLRTDRLIKDLLDFLDSHVGKGRYTIVLSADHGVCPLPEVAPAAVQPRRVLERELQVEAEEFLKRVFPGPEGKVFDAVVKEQTPVFYLNRAWMEKRALSPTETENALGGWLASRPETLTFYTRTRLEKGIPATDIIGQRVLKSFHKDRSGDVFLVTRPYHLLSLESNPNTGTSHGTPHDYDTHVPLIVFGPGVVPGKRETEFVTPQAAAPILARALGVPPPREAEAVVPNGLFRGQP
jgi:arylsulfatase A-like enzyme